VRHAVDKSFEILAVLGGILGMKLGQSWNCFYKIYFLQVSTAFSAKELSITK